MATIFNESTVTGEVAGAGALRQALLTPQRVPGSAIRLDRIAVAPGGHLMLDVPAASAAWIQMLTGAAELERAGESHALGDSHIAFLPPGRAAGFSSTSGAVFLYGEIPDAAAIDPGFAEQPPGFHLADWSREPVLSSQHDARRRIYLVTPKLFATKVIKGEMIFYPPGTAAANHHHEGAEHFMYVTRGRGTVFPDGQPHTVRAGDVIHYADREKHYLAADPDEELVFAEFFAPGECVTVWADDSVACTWLPTGRDIRGEMPVREIKAHRHGAASAQDV
jgi:quercetin dioxygenase-like cupin family protein